MELAKELEVLLGKRAAIRAKQVESYAAGAATRAKTTTWNAEADRLNERIVWIREQLKIGTLPTH